MIRLFSAAVVASIAACSGVAWADLCEGALPGRAGAAFSGVVPMSEMATACAWRGEV
jgi:hypothetical protein